MPTERILLIESEEIVRRELEQQLRYRGYNVTAVPTLMAARTVQARDTFDAIVTELRLPDGTAFDLLRELQSRPERPQVLVVSTVTDPDLPSECLRQGAFDFLVKPVSAQQVEISLRKAAEFAQLRKVNEMLCQEKPDGETATLLGNSPAIRRVRDLIRKVARTDATVLIHGESGTGKEVVARTIYRQSSRTAQPFIAVNCAAVPENLIESEFFGHEKGSFTGALSRREGRFELAHGGSIFLDEVSEISTQVQAKLLRVLQEREIQRVGGDRVIKVDVRVIASTNRNLRESIERKEFREDLFFRLNVVPIYLPPLRERTEDIPLLAEHFVEKHARKHGVKVAGISRGCMEAMMRHRWPGNVREIQNVLERAVILCTDGEYLGEEHLGFETPHDSSAAFRWAEEFDGGEANKRLDLGEVARETRLGENHRAGFALRESGSGLDQPMVRTSLPEPASLPAERSGAMAVTMPLPMTAPLPMAYPLLAGFGTGQDRLPTLQEVERQLIFAALARCAENRTHAAKMIGVSLRTLRSRLAEYRAMNGGVTPTAQNELAKFAAA